MSPCSLATAIVSVVAVIHFILTVVLTVATILVRRQSKKIKSQSSAKKDVNVPESSVRKNAAYSQDSDSVTSGASDGSRKHRRSGKTSPPEPTLLTVETYEDIKKKDLSFHKLCDTLGVSEGLVTRTEGHQLEKPHRDSTEAGHPLEKVSSAGPPFKKVSSSSIILQKVSAGSPFRKVSTGSPFRKVSTGSPFRKVSSGSPFRKVSAGSKSGRLSLVSITSKLSRRSVDVEGEESHLIETSMTTPEEEKQYDLSTSPAESEGSALRSEETLDIGGRNILALSDDPRSESEC